jgi:hypothetical protein
MNKEQLDKFLNIMQQNIDRLKDNILILDSDFKMFKEEIEITKEELDNINGV